MTIAEAEAIVQAVDYWHYPFDLPQGTIKPSRPGVDPDRHYRRKRHFFDKLVSQYSGSLQGKSVLDLGCCQGFWSIQASRSGASHCLGLDSSKAFVNEARAVATLLGVANCEFQCLQLENDPWWERTQPIEITLMLGVFYHLLDPISILRRAASLTTETLVLDSEVALGEGPYLKLYPRDPEQNTTRNSNPISNLRLVPTKDAMVSLLSDFGFPWIECLEPNLDTPPEYRSGHRMSIIAARQRPSHFPLDQLARRPAFSGHGSDYGLLTEA